MGWMQKLYETYERCYVADRSYLGDSDEPLLPICHTTQQAQIEVIIDVNGDFLGARVVPKDEATTVVPCTEKSGSRSGTKPVNHPLCDKLQYVAGDFVHYGGKVTRGFSTNPSEPFESYLQTLKAWCESEYGHPRAQAVLKYVSKCQLIKDLVASFVLFLGEDGQLLDRWDKSRSEDVPAIFAVSPGSQMDAFVRWIVEIPGDPGGPVWQDPTLFESWIKYYTSTKTTKSICYVTGEESLIADQHPDRLVSQMNNAKLISSNDTSGFTFRGRFLTADQACTVSFEVSQKAHAALRWLIARQGYVRDNQVIVAWATSGKRIPSLHNDSFDILGIDLNHTSPDDKYYVAWTAQEFAQRLNKKIAGYRAELGDASDVVVMALEAATPGRMSITFYRELQGSEFLDRIEHWHTTCSWLHNYKLKEVPAASGRRGRKVVRVKFVGAPSPNDIAEAAYGPSLDEKLRKATIERILPCIVDGRRVPRDLVYSAVRRASNRMGKEEHVWEKELSIACALYRNLHQEEGFTLALDESRRTRDYLYGRLLALAESLERWALRDAGEERLTNAERLMQRFADRPFSTWRTIELSLTPYISRLGNKARNRRQMISEVMALFEPEDFINDSKLSGEFLLGYHCQREALYGRSHDDEHDE